MKTEVNLKPVKRVVLGSSWHEMQLHTEESKSKLVLAKIDLLTFILWKIWEDRRSQKNECFQFAKKKFDFDKYLPAWGIKVSHQHEGN